MKTTGGEKKINLKYSAAFNFNEIIMKENIFVI